VIQIDFHMYMLILVPLPVSVMCGLRVVLEGVSGTVRAKGAARQGGGVDGYLDLHNVPVRDRRRGGAQGKLQLAGGLREIWILVRELGGGRLWRKQQPSR
jgi:hypothetical protein